MPQGTDISELVNNTMLVAYQLAEFSSGRNKDAKIAEIVSGNTEQ
jgi:hypothetical protein